MRILVFICLLCIVRVACAQPLEDWPTVASNNNAAANQEYLALRSELRVLQRDNPEKAVERYRAFLQKYPDVRTNVAVNIAMTIGQIQAGRLKNPQAALETYKSAFEKYGSATNSFSLLAQQAMLLQASGKIDEAEAVLVEHWDEALGRYYDDPKSGVGAVGPMMQQYVRLLEGRNKRDEIVTRLSRAMFDVPALLDEDVQGTRAQTGWMYDTMIEQLLALKRTDEALGWAKLRFMLCDYDQVAINRAVSTLARVWRARGAEGEAALRAFGEAQQDASRPNPLTAVPLPRMDEGHLALLARSTLAREAEFNVSLLIGDFGAAMEVAHQPLMRAGALAAGLRAIARVFKAADLNVHRANAFLAAFPAGDGADYVQKFLAEHDAADNDEGKEDGKSEPDSEGLSLKAFDELRARNHELEQTDPAEAIAVYRRFHDSQPGLSVTTGVLLAAKIARLHASIDDTVTAHAIYEWALERYGDHRAALRLILDRARLWKEVAIAPLKIVVPASS